MLARVKTWQVKIPSCIIYNFPMNNLLFFNRSVYCAQLGNTHWFWQLCSSPSFGWEMSTGIPFPSLPIQPPLHALATCCIPLWRQQVARGQSAQRYSQATLFPPYKLGDFYVNVAGTGEKWKNLCWKSFNWRIFGHLQWSMKIFFYRTFSSSLSIIDNSSRIHKDLLYYKKC